MSFYLCFLAGLFAGIFGGMGMGGGTLLIPVLTLLFSVPQRIAQSTNLFAFLPMALFSLPVHIKNGFIRKQAVLPLMPSALLFSVAFSFLADLVSGALLKKAFGAFLCLLSLYQFYLGVKLFTNKHKNDKIKS